MAYLKAGDLEHGQQALDAGSAWTPKVRKPEWRRTLCATWSKPLNGDERDQCSAIDILPIYRYSSHLIGLVPSISALCRSKRLLFHPRDLDIGVLQIRPCRA